jgi:trans-2,3-dihydro-3-hydroxyanthranilate isomerase
MSPTPFVWYDVFTDHRFAGNALAVFPDASGLTGEDMARIARELNLSETTFVLPAEAERTTHRVRIFTPARELPFAGHPVVGTAVALVEAGGGDHADLVFGLGAGPTPVSVRRRPDGVLTAQFLAPQVPRLGPPPVSAAEAAALVGLTASDLDPTFPVHQSDAGGTVFLVVRLHSLDALARSRPVGSAPGVIGIYLAVRTAHGWQSRMYAPAVGVVEDPATGSAAVSFAGSLHAHVDGYGVDGTHEVTIHQGIEMGRPSDLALSFDVVDGSVSEVRLAGSAVKVLDGVLG